MPVEFCSLIKPSALYSVIDLLSCSHMNCNWYNCLVLIDFMGDHHQIIWMFSYNHQSISRCIKISFATIPNNIFYFDQIKPTKFCSVFQIICPNNFYHILYSKCWRIAHLCITFVGVSFSPKKRNFQSWITACFRSNVLYQLTFRDPLHCAFSTNRCLPPITIRSTPNGL